MTNEQDIFEEIRPFHDDEVNNAIKNLLKDPEFEVFVRYLFKGFDRSEIYDRIKDISSIAEFQEKFVSAVMDVIIKKSVDSLTTHGIEFIDKQKAHVFISNHRDIVLDSALINYILYHNGFQTSEVAIGGNLLISPMISNIVRLNKSFIVKRNIPPRELYKYSKLLSAYISHVLFDKNVSIWIAQREGRAKDGNDKTQSSLLKMLNMNDEDGIKENYIKLNITPVAVSYEYDPCDMLKAIELYSVANGIPFVKTHQADFQSMITGIQGYKGKIEVAFCKPFTGEDYQHISGIHNNDWLKSLATYIDDRIYSAYKLWDTNLIAYDMLNETPVYSDRYSEASKAKFIAYLDEKTDKLDEAYPKDEIKRFILNMYAYPVRNKLASQLPV